MTWLSGLVVGLLSTTVASAPALPATASLELTAELYGETLALSEVALHHCHDRDLPNIRCFLTEQERDVDAGIAPAADLHVTGVDRSTASPTTASVFYVTFYEHSNYLGASYAASESIAHLGVFGWNDAISSFKSLNNQRPKWWRDINYADTSWQWPAGYWISYVGAGANDQFSSVRNVP